MSKNLPLITVLTPVYNGEKYLAECIESVLNQDYQNWKYYIVNNCSSDSSLDIAISYSRLDSRLKIVNNSRFVSVIENHNIAFNLVSQESKYCKVLSADDVMKPQFIGNMVTIFEKYPTVGIVGSYQLIENKINWDDLPPQIEYLTGHEVCRLVLLENKQIFGNPTSSMYRSDIVRNNRPFYPHLQPYADISACYKYLQHCDYGFIHEVLSMERKHEKQVSAEVKELFMTNIGCLEDFLKYGPIYLDSIEFKAELKNKINLYNRWLGGCLLKLNSIKFWNYQKDKLKELGYPINWLKVLKGAIDEIKDEIKNPSEIFKKISTYWKNSTG